MKPETYKALLKDLQKLQKTLVASQIAAVRRDPALSARFARLHREAEVGGGVDYFVATAAQKSTVLFLLRTVFVRVLEDLGILGIKRIRGEWGWNAFRDVAPTLNRRAYFVFIFRDLAIDFPSLFAPSPDELPLPPEDDCVAVWELWHHPNRKGEHYLWSGDEFDSRFLGDLYEKLDADIRKRYALLQTPRFVEEYVLDHTLSPALVEFDPAELRAKGQTFRLLDPTCGSGHFLIGAFHRIADYWRDRHGFSEWDACERALESVWGCDINPHAIDIAAFRLLLEIVARTGVKDLDRLAALTLNLRTLDSLIPWERGAKQREIFPAKDRLDAYATNDQRSINATFLNREFHAVVGNPPYIQPKDPGKAEDYRAFWPDSCFKEFCLNAPFLERFFVLGAPNAFTGQITANNFAWRSFGKAVLTKVLSKWRTTAVIDTSLAPIPGHGWKGGTSTVILFGRSSRFESGAIPWVLAKRRESTGFDDPSTSQAWLAIKNADLNVEQQGPYVDVQLRAAEKVSVWPWDLRGQEGQEITNIMDQSSDIRLDSLCDGRIGTDVITRAPELFEWTPRDGERMGLPAPLLRPFGDGKDIRDWHAQTNECLLVPYVGQQPITGTNEIAVTRALWQWRSRLAARFVSGGVTLADKKLPFFSLPQVPWHKHQSAKSIAFPFVTTEPHFALVEREAWFKHSVTLIKLKSSDDELWLATLGSLNASCSSYWLRGKFKGTGNVRELWEERLQIDEKLGGFPIPARGHTSIARLADMLVRFGERRAACLPAAVLAHWEPSELHLSQVIETARARYEEITRQMVSLQEELDWLMYGLYGLLPEEASPAPADIEPLAPGHRPFEIVLARRDEQASDGQKSAWWSRHDHDRVSAVPEHYSDVQRARLLRRIELINEDAHLSILESPTYKRRWQRIDWAAETKAAAEQWILDKIEDLFQPANGRNGEGPLANPRPYRLEEISAALSQDGSVAVVAGLWNGTGAAVDLTLLIEDLLVRNSVPDNLNRLYSSDGLRRIAEWKRVWGLQDQEDAWARATSLALAAGESVPPRILVEPEDPTSEISTIPKPKLFDRGDFTNDRFFELRGPFNVPRERFVSFADLTPPRFGWNGWRNRERALAQVEAYNLAENDSQQPLPGPTTNDPRRCGVTLGLWESLPDLKRWGSAADHEELQSLAEEACRQSRCPCPVVESWKAQVLRGETASEGALVALSTNGKGKGKRKAASRGDRTPETETVQTVSLPERAWIAGLLEAGKDVDLAGILALHRRHVDEAPASKGDVGEQLRISGVGIAVPPEVRSLDESRLALVVDDLVASGDIAVRGRGKKKRYQLVPRSTRA